MKKITLPIILVAFSIFALGTLPSCNKKLKKELEELDNSVDELKDKNAALEGQLNTTNTNLTNTQNSLNATNAALGANEPMISSGVSYNNASGALFSNQANSYFFKADDYSTQYIEDYQNGTYYIYIERFKDVDWNLGAWIEFDYNGSTASNVEFSVYDYFTTGTTGYYDLRFDEGYPENTTTITINSINTTTGDIDVRVSGTSTALYDRHYAYDYGNSIYNYSGNPEGGTASAILSFKGKLAVFKN